MYGRNIPFLHHSVQLCCYWWIIGLLKDVGEAAGCWLTSPYSLCGVFRKQKTYTFFMPSSFPTKVISCPSSMFLCYLDTFWTISISFPTCLKVFTFYLPTLSPVDLVFHKSLFYTSDLVFGERLGRCQFEIGWFLYAIAFLCHGLVKCT